VSFVSPRLAFAEGAAATPECHDNHETTIRQTEGPFFRPSSPERADLIEPDTEGRLVEINSLVMTRLCRPVERALLDLWHADEHGKYDDGGYRYSRTRLCERRRSLSLPHHPTRPLSRPHPPRPLRRTQSSPTPQTLPMQRKRL